MKTLKGFALIELLITLTLIVIIAVVSIYSYSSYVKRGRRIEGINTLLSMSMAEERYRSNHVQYGTLAQVWSGVTLSSSGYYSLAITSVSAGGYTLTATAQGNQANDAVNGTSCSVLTLLLTSGTLTKTPSACWPT